MHPILRHFKHRASSWRRTSLLWALGCGGGATLTTIVALADSSRHGPQDFSLPAVGFLPTASIDESSGLIASRRFPDVFWTHNDSGDSARIFAVRKDGSLIIPKSMDPEAYEGLHLEGAVNHDFEDIAITPDGRLVVGDIGNNGNQRRNLTVYLLPEPDPFTQISARAEQAVRFHYPEQTSFPPLHRNFDAESLFWRDGHLHLLTKHRADDWTKVYRFENLDSSSGSEPLTLLGSFHAGSMVTAADISADENHLAILTYSHLWVFTRENEGECHFQGSVRRLAIEAGQCEGVAFAGRDVWISNEEGFLFQVPLDAIPSFQADASLWAELEETVLREEGEDIWATSGEILDTPWLLLNEYNSVRDSRWLEDDGLAGSSSRDGRLGRIQGNGGNWFELVAIASPGDRGWLDLRGWILDWRQDNISGSIEFSDRAEAWARIPTGTLLTFAEDREIRDETGRKIVDGSRINPSFGSADDDWWMHIWTGDETLIRVGHQFSDAENTNNNFQLRIRDNTGRVVMDWTGEGRQPPSGVNSREVFQLATDPRSTVTPDDPAYTDSNHSSFGQPNRWREGGRWQTQDLRDLRR